MDVKWEDIKEERRLSWGGDKGKPMKNNVGNVKSCLSVVGSASRGVIEVNWHECDGSKVLPIYECEKETIVFLISLRF